MMMMMMMMMMMVTGNGVDDPTMWDVC